MFIFWLAVVTLIGAAIGHAKGCTNRGALWGFLLGPIGWAVVGFGDNKGPTCNACKGNVKPGATKCIHCGSALVIALLVMLGYSGLAEAQGGCVHECKMELARCSGRNGGYSPTCEYQYNECIKDCRKGRVEPMMSYLEPVASRCLGIQPICPPGKHPLCLCESDLSFNCSWVCTSQ